MPEQTSSIYKKLLNVMKAIGVLEKRGQNRSQGYDYLMAEDVLEEVRQKFGEVGLVLLPTCKTQEIISGQTQKGTANYLTRVEMEYTICDVDTGERLTLSWQGLGQDTGDKGLYKAYTGAIKYFLRNLLLIPTTDDPENDGSEPKPKRQSNHSGARTGPRTISEGQVKRLFAIAKQNGWSSDSVVAMVKRYKGYDDVADIKAGEEYEKIVEFFQKKQAPATVQEGD